MALQSTASRSLAPTALSLPMFTPPPSPLHKNSFSEKNVPSSPYRDDDDSDLVQLRRDDGRSHLLPTSPGLPQSPTCSPSMYSKKHARRRILIPLLAVVLVVAAAASRINSTDRWAYRWPTASSEDAAAPPTTWPFAASHATPDDPSSHPYPGILYHLSSSTKHLRRKRGTAPASGQSPGAVAAGNGVTTLTPPANPTPTSFSPFGGALSSLPNTNLTPPSIPDPPFPLPTPFPQPFDTTFSYNFSTSSCQSFFANSLLSNITFRSCRPLSLLIPASAAFFQAQSNLTMLTSIIGGTCATTPTADACVSNMQWFAGEIQKDAVCAKDLKDRNAMVLEALNGFLNYKFMREAGCLVNQRTNSYCLVDAVSSSSSDFYFYTLALGTPLPNKTQPSCSTCVESLLSIYALQANNHSLDISKTYPAAAQKAIAVCGSQYATAMNAVGEAIRMTMEKGLTVRWVTISVAIGIAFAVGVGTIIDL